MKKYLVGIDEVGRGPLAGPVAVGACAATKEVLKKFRKIKESKQLSRKQREEWYAKLIEAKGPEFRFAVSYVSAKTIDQIGIAPAIRKALAESLKKLNIKPESCRILLDGGLHAPEEYRDQRTIIRGDAKETVIAMASVVAKVERDRLMIKMHKKFPQYGFDRNVGYGTKEHIRAIKKLGLTTIHRRTFTRGLDF